MEDNKRIEIVADDNNIVTFDTIVRDTINREDVVLAEEEIARLEQEICERNERIEALKAKIAHAKEIIAIADAKKLAEAELEQPVEE
jgi:hypothetical protein